MLKKVWSNQWFFLTMMLVVVLSYFKANVLGGLNVFSSPFLFITMFLLGLDKDLDKIILAIKNVKALIFTVIFAFLISPLLGFILGKLFLSHYLPLFSGLIVMVSVGGTIAPSIIWTRLSGGNDTLSLTLALVNTILSSLITPIILFVALGSHIRFEPFTMLFTLVEVTVIPVIIAQIIKRLFRRQIVRIYSIIPIVSRIILLFFISLAVAQSASYLNMQTVLVSLPIVIGHHLIMIALSFIVSEKLMFSRKDRIALIYASSQNAFIPAVFIISKFFHPSFTTVPLIYHISQESLAQNFTTFFKKYW